MSKKAKVLVVDDNESNLELFMDFLDVGGYEALSASNGEDAIEIVRREHPDLVLLDIQLPGMDGIDVARTLKGDEGTKHIKIVALTAYAMQVDRDIFMDKALDGYIAKPVSLKEFLKALDGYLM